MASPPGPRDAPLAPSLADPPAAPADPPKAIETGEMERGVCRSETMHLCGFFEACVVACKDNVLQRARDPPQSFVRDIALVAAIRGELHKPLCDEVERQVVETVRMCIREIVGEVIDSVVVSEDVRALQLLGGYVARGGPECAAPAPAPVSALCAPPLDDALPPEEGGADVDIAEFERMMDDEVRAIDAKRSPTTVCGWV